jgi:hypothetical protein
VTWTLVRTLALPTTDTLLEEIARHQLVRLTAESHHVMALISRRLQPREQRRKIDIALARIQVDFFVAQIISQAYLANAANAEGIDEAVDPLRNEVGVVDGEGPAELWRRDGLEIVAALVDVMRQVVDLRSASSYSRLHRMMGSKVLRDFCILNDVHML